MDKRYPVNIVLAYIPHKGKVLLNKRIDEPYKNIWALIGGHLEIGETIEECIEREVKEETNLDAKFLALRGIASEVIYDEEKPVNHLIIWVCEVKVKNGDAREMEEGEIRWFSRKGIEQMKDKMISSDYLMLHHFIFKDKTRLPLHKIRVQKREEKYEVEYFGL
ncbi:MAG: NUDIX hydrolase [Candidatus Portnoybacteria bacterium]|nr:NUDIX hydrolase [Candidatus Portnoybacteria bacterium]